MSKAIWSQVKGLEKISELGLEARLLGFLEESVIELLEAKGLTPETTIFEDIVNAVEDINSEAEWATVREAPCAPDAFRFMSAVSLLFGPTQLSIGVPAGKLDSLVIRSPEFNHTTRGISVNSGNLITVLNLLEDVKEQFLLVANYAEEDAIRWGFKSIAVRLLPGNSIDNANGLEYYALSLYNKIYRKPTLKKMEERFKSD